ncbi:class I SAM-dependent methyltransferase [Paenibacillus albiflavus]|uniref:Class I SAM-dependent methyltransferase n=1 Tax=Paenibacillus albiflavus TaxID=2545760 RepID=A0A4R4E1F1_9BACL|nr:class I SAM-dependent methyltransferase [Paenibacillus albiflavus]TCZ68560.1 class I SAM-dependent methyltransferase [Paenibacillus albiflavus]
MKNWDEHYLNGNFTNWDLLYPSQELVAFIATMTFPKKKVALDVGCGAGREAIFLAQQGWDVIGVDISTEALRIAAERAKEVGVEVDWRQGDILSLPVENKFIDFVNDRGCFHSIIEENRDQYVNEIAQILKPGGMMLLRGCRDEKEKGHFVPVTEISVDRYFGKYFVRGPVLPLQMDTGSGYNHEGMKGNLVVLKKT